MNKNISLLALAILSIVIVLYVFFNEEAIDKDTYIETIEESTHQDIEKDATIQYTSKSVSKSNDEKAIVTSKEKKKPSQEIKAYANNRKYKITLIDSTTDTIKQSARFVPLRGKIDGFPFILNVPDYMITTDSANIVLQIKNNNTDQIESTPAYFLNDLKDLSFQHTIDINSNDINTIEHTQRKNILPLPGQSQYLPQ